LVDEGECGCEGVGGLSFNEMEVVTVAGVHGGASHESSGTVGADTSGSWLKPDGWSIDAHLKPAPCEFRNSCWGGGGMLKHEKLPASLGPLCRISSPSLFFFDRRAVGRCWMTSGGA
jgi:hypothetical protein